MQFEFRPYSRRFQKPLKTGHGEWRVREGIILRFRDDLGDVRFGEIAPLSWFGSETQAEALEFCQQLPPEMADPAAISIPNQLPACQFGFESAFQIEQIRSKKLVSSRLLPAGTAALETWMPFWEQGYCTFKWKIGVEAIAIELAIFHQLIQTLPASARLRLDANGNLSDGDAKRWLQTCDNIQAQASATVEYLEQPLSTDNFDQMQQLSRQFATPIALDESVNHLAQLQACYDQGWRGAFVIKPAIAGSPTRLRQFCQATEIDIVISSVFETAIGQRAVMALAEAVMGGDRAVGFGLDHWFPADDPLRSPHPEQLWERL